MLSNDRRLLIGRREAASRLSVSLRTLDSLVAGRELPAKRVGRRVLIHVRDLEKFAAGNHPDVHRS